MSNLVDYLDWRGDLTFANAPLNEVDALVFAWISYYEYEKLEAPIVGRTIAEIAALHEAKFGPFQKIRVRDAPGTPIPSAIWMLHCASLTKRFAGLRVLDFQAVNTADTQFGAITIEIVGRRVIAYRGTDNSLIGWREDCDLSFSEEVPSQKLALEYLNRTDGDDPLIVCGHSKGGNIAVYAAVNARKAQRDRIERLYNFDGPGFCYDIAQREGYRELLPKMDKIVPESSVVGMLLKDDSPYRVIDSKMRGLFQHNGMFWQVLGTRFVEIDRRTASSLILDETLRGWINGMPPEQRRAFTDVIFTVIESTGVKDFAELDDHALLTGRRILSGIRTLSREQKKMALQLLLRLVKAAKSVVIGDDEPKIEIAIRR